MNKQPIRAELITCVCVLWEEVTDRVTDEPEDSETQLFFLRVNIPHEVETYQGYDNIRIRSQER